MVILISIVAGILIYLLLNITAALYIGASENYNDSLKLYTELVGSDEKTAKKKKAEHTKELKKFEFKKEKIAVIAAAAGVFVLFYLAFSSILIGTCMAIAVFTLPYMQRKQKKEKKKKAVPLQLAEALRIITASLKAGESMTNAMIHCSDDLELLYKNEKENEFILYFQKMKSDLELGVSVDAVLKNFAEEWPYEDVRNFTAAITAVREKGGNLTEVMENVTRSISDKVKIETEIERQTAAKRFEAKIMNALPIVLFCLLSLISRDYMKPMYETAIGKALVILSVVLIIMNVIVSKKIVDLKI